MADFTFQERATGTNINVAQSILTKKRNSCQSMKFKISYVGEITVGSTADYYDQDNNLIINGLIKEAKEIAKDINTEQRIYELTIYDYGYNLIDGNLNDVFRSLTPEEIIQDIIEENSLTFDNQLPAASGITIAKKVYKDLDPIEAVNDLCEMLGAAWRINQTTFTLFRRGDFLCTEEIDGTDKWATDGWSDDTDKQAKKIILKGAKILQRTSETVTGTDTTFTLSRTPEDMQISGLVQTTETIDGDYSVDKEAKQVTFDVAQTDPTFEYSYYSQLRAEIGDGSPIKVIEKNYIEDIAEARKLGRKYISIYGDGIQSSDWTTSDIYTFDITNFNVGDMINVKNKLSIARDGKYEITKIVRKYPQKIVISVGESSINIFDWQAESKGRLKQLTQIDQNDDYNQYDKFSTGDVKVTINSQLTKLLVVTNTGEILWASDTTLANDADLISDTGLDEDYPLAYDDDGLPAGTYEDLLN